MNIICFSHYFIGAFTIALKLLLQNCLSFKGCRWLCSERSVVGGVCVTSFTDTLPSHHKTELDLHTITAISRSSQCSTTGVTKAVVCVILSVGWCI